MLSPLQYKRMSQETMNDGEEMTPVLHQKKASEMEDFRLRVW
jgi:hypothetical protein